MKQVLRKFGIVVVTIVVITSQAFAITFYDKTTAGYDIVWSDDAVYYSICQAALTDLGSAITRASPTASYYQYKVVISYDELAAKVTHASSYRINTSLYQNAAAGYWVGYVHDIDYSVFDGGTNTGGTLGNGNGYVYVAEIDTTGEDTVSLLESINRNTANVSSYINSVAASLQSLVDSHRMIRDWFDEWDAYFANINTKIDSVSTNVSSIMADVENMRLDIVDIADFVTGEAMTDMLSDVSTINTNITAINTFNNSLKTHILTIKNNSNSMVTLLDDLALKLDAICENTANITISGDSFTFDDLVYLTDDLIYLTDEILTSTVSVEQQITSTASNTAAIITQLNVLTDLSAKLDVLDDLSLKLDAVSENTANITIDGDTFDFDDSNIVSAIEDLTYLTEAIFTSIDNHNYMDLFYEIINDVYAELHTLTVDLYEYNGTRSREILNLRTALEGKLDTISENTANISIEGGVFDDAAIIASIDAAAESVVSKLDDMSESTVENITNITINEGDPAYEVFYVTDQDGDKKNLGDLSGDMLIAGGKLLNFFFKVAFDGAIESVDSTIDGMTEFYLDDAVVLEGSLWE